MTTLPIFKHLPEIGERIKKFAVTIVTATTGSGKSTNIPVYLARSLAARVLVISPTITATLSLHKRVQFLSPDLKVDYACGGECYYSDRTNIAFVTAGHAKNLFISNQDNHNWDVIMIDESHTVSADYELLLCFLKEALHIWQERGLILPKIVISSATIDLEAEREGWRNLFLGSAVTHLEITMPMYPIETVFATCEYRDMKEILTSITLRILSANRSFAPGHFLVFLPGVSVINELYQSLSAYQELSNCWLYTMSSQQPFSDTQAALEQRVPQEGDFDRAIILATDIAETSVTIPGVNLVLDSGKQKVIGTLSNGNEEDGTILTLQDVSKFAATQRKGRTGRTNPGTYMFFGTEDQFEGLSSFYSEELNRTPLYSYVLQVLTHNQDPYVIAKWSSVDSDRITNAVNHLLRCGALVGPINDPVSSPPGGPPGGLAVAPTVTPTVTPMGKFIAALPVSFFSAKILYQYHLYTKTNSQMDCLMALFVSLVDMLKSNHLIYMPRRRKGQSQEEYNMTKEAKKDKLAEFSDVASCPLHAALVIAVRYLVMKKKQPSQAVKWSAEYSLNNKTLRSLSTSFARLVKTLRWTVAPVSELTDDMIAEFFYSLKPLLLQVVDLNTMVYQESRGKWVNELDPETMLRVDNRQFSMEPPQTKILALNKFFSRNGGHTNAFITLYYPL